MCRRAWTVGLGCLYGDVAGGIWSLQAWPLQTVALTLRGNEEPWEAQASGRQEGSVLSFYTFGTDFIFEKQMNSVCPTKPCC